MGNVNGDVIHIYIYISLSLSLSHSFSTCPRLLLGNNMTCNFCFRPIVLNHALWSTDAPRLRALQRNNGQLLKVRPWSVLPQHDFERLSDALCGLSAPKPTQVFAIIWLYLFQPKNGQSNSRTPTPLLKSPVLEECQPFLSHSSRFLVVLGHTSKKGFHAKPLMSGGLVSSISHRIHVYMATWIPSIYPSHVSIYISTMDPIWVSMFQFLRPIPKVGDPEISGNGDIIERHATSILEIRVIWLLRNFMEFSHISLT